MRVLMLEDDSSSAQSVDVMLKAAHFDIFVTNRGEEGVELAKLYDYDVILLALNLPDLSGAETLRALRAARVRAPVLILADVGGIGDRLKSFGFGAENCLARPFDGDDLVARIRAAVERAKATASAAGDNGRLRLSGPELQLLHLLSAREGATMTEEMLVDAPRRGRDEPDLTVTDLLVRALREKRAEACRGEQAETARDGDASREGAGRSIRA